MRTAYALALSAALCAAPLTARAETRDAALAAAVDAVSSAEPQAHARLVADFSGFAGSDANARSLVAGLRQGEEITLTASGAPGQLVTVTRFTPPTRPMDYGNVRMALALAREQLAQLDITQPTPSQINAVLAGGGIASRTNGRAATPYLYPGVLQMRAGGMSWSKIAATMGITLAQAMNGRVRPSDVSEPPESRRPATAAATGTIVSVAGAQSDASAQRRPSAAPAPISAASITTSSAGGPRTSPAAKAGTLERRPPRDEPAPRARARPSATSVVAAADSAAKAEKVTAPVPAAAPADAVRAAAAAAPSASAGSSSSEEGPATE